MTRVLFFLGAVSLALYLDFLLRHHFCGGRRPDRMLLAPAIIFFFLAACGDSGRAWFWHVATGGWMW